MGDIVFPGAAGTSANVLYSYFYSVLQQRGIANRFFTDSEITTGLDTTIYATEAAATGGGDPASTGVPNFRIVDDGSTSVKLAYWDHITGAGGTWSVTSAPYNFPVAFTTGGFVLDTTDDSNHATNAAFNTFGASNIYQVLQDCAVGAFSHHQGGSGAGSAVAYSVIRSLVQGGTTQPPDSSFSQVLAQFTAIPAADQWTTAAISPTIGLRKGEWVALQGAAIALANTGSTAVLAADETNDLLSISEYRTDFSPPSRLTAPTSVDGTATGLSMGVTLSVTEV